MKRIFALVMAVVFIGAAMNAGSRGQEESTPAPDFALKDLQGNPVSLSDYKGKVLVLNFWATWCPPCRAEIPDFIDAYKDLKAKGLEILGVSVDRLTPERLRTWTEQAKINYPVALATSKIVTDYEPGEYIPATIVIDKSGRIRYRHVSMMDRDTLVRLFEEYSK